MWAGGVEDACEGAKGQSLLGLASFLRPGAGNWWAGDSSTPSPAILAAVFRVLGPSDPPSLSPADQDGANSASSSDPQPA